MDKTSLKRDLTSRMEKAMEVLDRELKGLRTGRASVNLLEPVQVEVYGSKQSLPQVASISTSDARTLSVQVWDKSNVKAVEKAIIDSNLGLTPNTDGQLIRMSLPMLSEETRKKLVKLAYEYGENTKVAIRNIRRDGNDELKKLEKDNVIAKDEHHTLSDDIQKLTEEFNKKIDQVIIEKEKEILKV